MGQMPEEYWNSPWPAEDLMEISVKNLDRLVNLRNQCHQEGKPFYKDVHCPQCGKWLIGLISGCGRVRCCGKDWMAEKDDFFCRTDPFAPIQLFGDDFVPRVDVHRGIEEKDADLYLTGTKRAAYFDNIYCPNPKCNRWLCAIFGCEARIFCRHCKSFWLCHQIGIYPCPDYLTPPRKEPRHADTQDAAHKQPRPLRSISSVQHR